MDSLTHGLLGAAIAEAGFRSRLGRVGTLLGAGIALLPDFDFIVVLFTDDPFATLRHHRAETHSIPILTLAAPLLAWGIWRLRRRRERFRDWWLMTWLVLLSAAILDAFTTYGTQLLAPFTRHRHAWEIISIIDIFYTLPLLLAFVLAMTPRIPPRISQRIATGVLLLTTLYLGAGAWNRAQVIRIVRTLPAYADASAHPATDMESRSDTSGDPSQAEILATPCFSTIWLWRVVTRTRTPDQDTYSIYLVSAWTGRIVSQDPDSSNALSFAFKTGIQPQDGSGVCATPPSAPPEPVGGDAEFYPMALTIEDTGGESSLPNLPADLHRGGHRFLFATRSTPRPPPAVVQDALGTETGVLLKWFSNGWLTWQVEPTRVGTRISFYDLRYGTVSAPAQTPFAWTLLYNEAGSKTDVIRLRPWDNDQRLGWTFIRDEFRLTWRKTWE